MEWISVKDRLPSINEFARNEVLTWNGHTMSVSIPTFYHDGSVTFIADLMDAPIKITHWMALPEAPK